VLRLRFFLRRQRRRLLKMSCYYNYNNLAFYFKTNKILRILAPSIKAKNYFKLYGVLTRAIKFMYTFTQRSYGTKIAPLFAPILRKERLFFKEKIFFKYKNYLLYMKSLLVNLRTQEGELHKKLKVGNFLWSLKMRRFLFIFRKFFAAFRRRRWFKKYLRLKRRMKYFLNFRYFKVRKLSRYNIILKRVYNNLFFTAIESLRGDVYEKASGGMAKLKGAKRATPFGS